MLNYIWAGMIVLGIIFGSLNGNMKEVTEATLDSAGEAVSLCIAMAGIMALWVGLMEVAESSGLIMKLTDKLSPFISFMFPGLPRKHKARDYISLNIIANESFIIGLNEEPLITKKKRYPKRRYVPFRIPLSQVLILRITRLPDTFFNHKTEYILCTAKPRIVINLLNIKIILLNGTVLLIVPDFQIVQIILRLWLMFPAQRPNYFVLLQKSVLHPALTASWPLPGKKINR